MSEVERAIAGWQCGDTVAAMRVCEWLWQKHHPIVCKVFKRTDAFKAEDTAADASKTGEGEKGAQRTKYGAKNADHFVDEGFWAALEELELMLHPPEPCWTKPTDQTKQVSKQDKDETRRVFEGQVTERVLTERDTLQWQDEEQFEKLFRDMWIKRARNALDKELRLHNNITTRAKLERPSNSQEGGGAGVFFRRTSGFESLEATRDHTTTYTSGAAYEDEISGQAVDGQRVALECSAVLELVAGLAQWAEQLRFAGHKRLYQTIEALLRYVKSQAAKTHPQYAASCQQELQQVKIEELLMSSNVYCLDFDEEEAWQFVQDDLGLSRATVYKRKQRLGSLLQSPLVSNSLRAAAGLLWLRNMRYCVEDCRKTAQRIDGNSVAALQMIDIFLRWTFAKGHPNYRHRTELKWLESMQPKDLFTSNDPRLLTPTYPGAGDFRRFVAQHDLHQQGILAELPLLRDALKNLSSRPIRLITVLEALG